MEWHGIGLVIFLGRRILTGLDDMEWLYVKIMRGWMALDLVHSWSANSSGWIRYTSHTGRQHFRGALRASFLMDLVQNFIPPIVFLCGYALRNRFPWFVFGLALGFLVEVL